MDDLDKIMIELQQLEEVIKAREEKGNKFTEDESKVIQEKIVSSFDLIQNELKKIEKSTNQLLENPQNEE